MSYWHKVSAKLCLNLIGLHKPERDPRAHDDDCERNVDLEEVEAEGALEGELHEDHGPADELCWIYDDHDKVNFNEGLGPVPPPHADQAVAVGPVDHHVLCQAKLLHAKGII